MVMQPLVTIIIPSYNHAQYIEQAIQSVLDQTYPNIELVIVDDGSKDNSHEVIKKYLHHPNVTAFLNTENSGQSAAFKQGLRNSSGKYVCFLPSDDWYLPEKTKKQVAKFETCDPGVGVVYCRGKRYFDDTGAYKDVTLPVFTGWVAEKFITWGPFVYPVTPLFKREAFEKAQLNEIYKAEGEAVYINIAMHYRFEYVDEILAVMRDHTYNIGKDVEVMHDEVVKYWEAFFKRDDLPSYLKGLRHVRMERAYRVSGMKLVGERRKFKAGRKCLLQALKFKPSLILKPKILGVLGLTVLPKSISNHILDKHFKIKA